MKRKQRLFIASLIICFWMIFIQSYTAETPTRHSLGFPVKFISYIGKNPPQNSIELFFLRNIKHISFAFGNYIISTIIIYLALKLLLFIIYKIGIIKRANY
ncbi:hypothetical protein SAMN02194393_02059 [Maledivibacter halophilus]|uniref:Uncharacterized protein n=1 Tax=Maledivibacter halophilus TaxID=36842 RepID=A0A1T5KRD3_9FIRM|nr:hypothetical protein SAMN02194393_02059 [Maledivibacter halophilus]